MKGIRYPVAIADIPKIERQNDISVNVLGFEDNEFFPLYISHVRGAKHELHKQSIYSNYCQYLSQLWNLICL
jgi:hypothetical protein